MLFAMDAAPPPPAVSTETLIARPPAGFRPYNAAGDDRYYTQEFVTVVDRSGVPEAKVTLTGYTRNAAETLDSVEASRKRWHMEGCPHGKVTATRSGSTVVLDAWCPQADKRLVFSEVSKIVVTDQRVYSASYRVKGRLNGWEKSTVRKWLETVQVCRVKAVQIDGRATCPDGQVVE